MRRFWLPEGNMGSTFASLGIAAESSQAGKGLGKSGNGLAGMGKRSRRAQEVHGQRRVRLVVACSHLSQLSSRPPIPELGRRGLAFIALDVRGGWTHKLSAWELPGPLWSPATVYRSLLAGSDIAPPLTICRAHLGPS